MEPAIVYHPDRRARLVVCLPTRFAVSKKSVLANDRCANAARFPSRHVVWERVFVFPNKSATLGWGVPAVGGAIPIEEFVFYLAGFMLVLLSYIWCDEYWMGAYNVPDYAATAENIPRIVRFHFASVVVGILLIAAAILYRKFLSRAPEGFPWYFVYLVCASLIPSAGVFHSAKPFINWRAFSFTFFLLLLISCSGKRRSHCLTVVGSTGRVP